MSLIDENLCLWLEQVMSQAQGRLVIGLGGPGGCGKSTLAERLAARYQEVSVLSLDHYRLPRRERPVHARYGSHPDASDLIRLRRDLETFRKTGRCTYPVYNPVTGDAAPERAIQGGSVLLAEGELAAYDVLTDCWDSLILIRSSLYEQLRVRLKRDWRERGTALSKVLHVFWVSNLRHYPRYSQGVEQRVDFEIRRGRR